MALSLKTAPTAKSPAGDGPRAFDPERLKQELLSLNHPRITPEVAQAITQEVSATLKDHPDREVTALWVSQVVEERLLNRGILHRPGETAPQAEEETRSNRTQGLLQKGQRATLPTLEKFLKNSQPPPPKARVQIHGDPTPTQGESWEERFAQVARRAAEAESRFAAPGDVETLSVEFFNAMANQEFYPHRPELSSLMGRSMASGEKQLWMELPLGLDSAGAILKEAKKAWRQGCAVSFVIPAAEASSEFSEDDFEEFLQGVERALLELPDTQPLPTTVGLYLDLENPRALSWARLALSGKYYPKFSVCLGVPEGSHPPEDLDELRRLGPLLLHPKTSSCSGQNLYPRWGGGPDLEPWELCQLGSVNLAIVANGSDVDWGKLRRVVRSAVHFLENLIETEAYPLETVAECSRANRKIGLGVMGYAELLIKLGIPYQSDTALTLAEKIMRFVGQEALACSHQLAKARGVFPNFSKSHWKAAGRKIRHRTLTAVCPAPEQARLAGVTPGWSPLESILQWDGPEDEARLKPLGLLQKIATRQKAWSPALQDALLSNPGAAIGSSERLPQELRDLFATRAEISPWTLCLMQAAFERHSEGAAGFCYPLAKGEHEIPLSGLLQEAWSLKLRQVYLAQDLRPRLLVFRENLPEEEPAGREETPAEASELDAPSMAEDITEAEGPAVEMAVEEAISAAEETEELTAIEAIDDVEDTPVVEEVTEIEDTRPLPPQPRPLPDLLQARCRRVETLHGPMRVTVGYDDLGPYEFSAQVGKAGGEPAAQAEALSRLISLLFSLGVEPQTIIAELKDIRAFPAIPGEPLRSIPDGIAHALWQECGQEEASAPVAEEIEEEVTEVLEAGTIH